MAGSRREDLVVCDAQSSPKVEIDDALHGILGRSLKLRQVSAGGCNACEADTNVLNTVGWDLGRFGIQFVASPRHADGLLITGPVTENMRLAVAKTYQAVPSPKLVIAVGAARFPVDRTWIILKSTTGQPRWYRLTFSCPAAPLTR